MNRRGFLGSIAGFAAACTLDPELALWKPGAKLISVPKIVSTGGLFNPHYAIGPQYIPFDELTSFEQGKYLHRDAFVFTWGNAGNLLKSS